MNSLVNFVEGLLVDINAPLLGPRDNLLPSEGQGEVAVSRIVDAQPRILHLLLKLQVGSENTLS